MAPLLLRLVLLLLVALPSQHATCAAAKFAPNHFLGSCLDRAWVDRVRLELGVSGAERDAQGRLLHPHLHAALKTPRFTVEDPRTAVPMTILYQSDCMPAGSTIYGVGATVDANGEVVDSGRVNGTLIMEFKGWPSIQLTTLVFAIVAQELFGYEISFFWTTNSGKMGERMSNTGSGLCAPVHGNMEVWIDALLEQKLAGYSSDIHSTGDIGYNGRSGIYTTTQLITDGLDPAKSTPTFSADYWRDYVSKESLITSLPVSTLTSNTEYFPPTELGCPDGTLGCSNSCSKTEACVTREAQGKECLVVIMMYSYYEPGYIQSVFENNGIPATFCFIGLNGAQSFVLETQRSGQPVLFYHYEPDPFHFQHPGVFDRVMFPHSKPQEAALTNGEFGTHSNLVRVDYPYTSLQKYSSSMLETNHPIESLLSRMWISDYDMDQLLKTYVDVESATTPADDIEFTTACTWLKNNYDVWSLWLGRLPMCDAYIHITYDIIGCDTATSSASTREIVFKWKLPDPSDSTRPYDCDGGVRTLPDALITSRSCEWLKNNPTIWLFWSYKPPVCDPTFFTYSVSGCNHTGSMREVRYRWLIESSEDPSLSAECTDGVHLSDSVLLECEYVPYDASGFTAIAALACILASAIVLAMAFVFHYRHQPVVKRSQYEFLLAMLLGGVFNCASVWLYAGKPTRLLCGFRSVGISLGFTFIFGSLVVKSLRVYRVFMSGAMKRVVLSAKTMFRILALFVVIDIVLLGAWNIADPSEPTIIAEATPQLGGDPVERIRCTSSSFIFTALLIFWKAILLFSGLYLSFLIRKVSSDFQESVWIFASAIVVLLTSLILLPLAYLVDLPATTFYLFFSILLLLSTTIVMSLMIVPKIIRLNEQATETTTSNVTSTGPEQASPNGPTAVIDETTKNSTTGKPKGKAGSSKKASAKPRKPKATQVQPISSK